METTQFLINWRMLKFKGRKWPLLNLVLKKNKETNLHGFVSSLKVGHDNFLSFWFLLSFAGGDSKTLMIVQIAPVEKNLGESVCSLNFAQRVRTVELGQASRQILQAGDEVRLHKRRSHVSKGLCSFFILLELLI